MKFGKIYPGSNETAPGPDAYLVLWVHHDGESHWMNATQIDNRIRDIRQSKPDIEVKPRLKKMRIIKYDAICEKAYSEYDAICEKASSEYAAIRKKAYSEYDAICEKASSEYDAIRKKASSEYDAIRKKASSEYDAIYEKAYSEYDAIREKAYSEFGRTIDKRNMMSGTVWSPTRGV